MTPSQILQEAKSLIEHHGWTRKRMGNHREGFCAIGAVSHAAIGSEPAARSRAVTYLCGQAPKRHIIRWNDRPWRRKSQVLGLFDKAIRAAEREEIIEEFRRDLRRQIARDWMGITEARAELGLEAEHTEPFERYEHAAA